MYRADQKGNTKQDTQIRTRNWQRRRLYQMKKLRKMRKQKVQMLTLPNAEAQMEGTEDEGTAENTETAEDASARMRQLQMRRLHRTCRKFCHLSILMTIPLWNGRYPAMS